MLTDDYVSGKKIKLTSKTSDGLSYTVSGATGEKSNDLIGELNVKVKQKAATISAKLLTNADPTGEIKYERSDAQGPQGNVTLTASRAKAVLKSEVMLSRAGIQLQIDALKREVVTSVTGALIPALYPGFIVFGAEGMLQVNEGTISNTKLAASLFDGRESEIMVEIEGKGEVASLSYSHLVRPGLSVAGKMRYSGETKNAVADMGMALKLDGGTTVKGKFDTNGTAALSYIQMVRANTKMIMSSSFDLARLDSTKVGLAITIE